MVFAAPNALFYCLALPLQKDSRESFLSEAEVVHRLGLFLMPALASFGTDEDVLAFDTNLISTNAQSFVVKISPRA
jgi:hypothetical protein